LEWSNYNVGDPLPRYNIGNSDTILVQIKTSLVNPVLPISFQSKEQIESYNKKKVQSIEERYHEMATFSPRYHWVRERGCKNDKVGAIFRGPKKQGKNQGTD
jgi:hypothetical protein